MPCCVIISADKGRTRAEPWPSPMFRGASGASPGVLVNTEPLRQNADRYVAIDDLDRIRLDGKHRRRVEDGPGADVEA